VEESRRHKEKIGRLDKKLAEAANREGYAERVRKLRAFRGIDYLTALSLICEGGDYQRFPTAEACVPPRAPGGWKTIGTPRGGPFVLILL
jgi:hypothetical protein